MSEGIKPKIVDGLSYHGENAELRQQITALKSELAEAQTTIRLAERSIAAYDADLTRVRRERDQLRNDHQRVVGERDRARRDLHQL